MRDHFIVVLSLIVVGLLISHYHKDKKQSRRAKKEKEQEYCGHYHSLRADILSNADLTRIPDLENQILDLFNTYKHLDDMVKLFEMLEGREKYLYSKTPTTVTA